MTDETIDGADPYPSGPNFSYDNASRLTTAHVTGHSYTYNFAATGGCGADTAAGKNTNRTSLVDNATTTTYCYDNADRLTSTSATGYSGITYDTHGNTATIGGETHTYDGADRHVATTAGATSVRYARDATDRLIERKVNGTTAERYSYTGGGDTPDATLDASGNVIEQNIGLPGGASITKRASGDVWSYSDLHGDDVSTANSTGTKTGATLAYEPFGTPLAGLPDNGDGALDYGWLGSKQRPLEHQAGLLNIIEMGARQYSPTIGRFLEVDPIEGGSANDYDYAAADPENAFDLAGTCRTHHHGAWGYVRSARCRGNHLIHHSGHFLGSRVRSYRNVHCALYHEDGGCYGGHNARRVLRSRAVRFVNDRIQSYGVGRLNGPGWGDVGRAACQGLCWILFL